MKKNKVIESLNMDYNTYKKIKGTLDPKQSVNITGDKPAVTNTSTSTSTSTMEEAEAVIEPQDQSTIKYLSNVKDEQNNISQPFNIGGKNYQMVRGINPQKQIVMGVYCFDDLNESGENIIHPVDHFEKTIAIPMRERMNMAMNEESDSKSSEQPKSDNPDSLRLGDYKHFIVDETSGKFKKFQNIQDLAKYPMSDNEKYMGLSEFKKYFHDKVFGPRKHNQKVDNSKMVSESRKVVKTIKVKDIK